MLCCTAPQAAAWRSCHVCRATQLRLFSRRQDDQCQTIAEDAELAAHSAEDCVQSGCVDIYGPQHVNAVITSSPHHDWQHSSNLWSVTITQCQPCMTTAFTKHAFWCSAPAVWNLLAKTVSGSVTVFKSRLKSFLPGFLSFLYSSILFGSVPLKLQPYGAIQYLLPCSWFVAVTDHRKSGWRIATA